MIEENEITMEDLIFIHFIQFYGMRTKTLKEMKISSIDITNETITLFEMKITKKKIRQCDILSLINHIDSIIEKEEYLFPNYRKLNWQETRDRVTRTYKYIESHPKI